MKRHTTPEKAAQMRAAAAQRLGLAGYARMLGTLVAGPKSTAEIAQICGVFHTMVLHAMRHLLRCRVVHREQWFQPQAHARMVPKWALGADGDVSMPKYEERTRRPRRAPSMLILLTTVIEMLSTAAMTRTEIAAELRMHVDSACRVLDALRSVGLVHVESWSKPATGTTSAEWRFGQRHDAKRPPRTPQAEYFRRWRKRRADMRVMHALAGLPRPAQRSTAC